MYTSDTIGDFLTRIRNAHHREKEVLVLPASKMVVGIAEILKREGFIANFQLVEADPEDERAGNQKQLQISLKYVNGQAAISRLQRISKPGIRRYVGYRELRPVRQGMGITILSTPQGIMTGEQARAAKVGGELLCMIY